MLPPALPWTGLGGFWRGALSLKSLFLLAPRAGFEPATNRLTAGCSTTELPGNGAGSDSAYNKAARLCLAQL
jgi:hypothetical protein